MNPRKPTKGEIGDVEEAKQAIKVWFPTDSTYRLGMIPISATHIFPAKRYARFVQEGGDTSYHYWVKRLQDGGTVTPIVVEPAMLYNASKTSVDGWYVRDGLHRLAAAKTVGKLQAPALIIVTPCDDLVRTFRTATQEELDNLFRYLKKTKVRG